METNQNNAARSTNRPNILVLCMDQWQTHMRVPDAVRYPATERLESQGVSFDHQYCTVPICTPSRATMWTGVHAIHTGLWDNTNFAWIDELSREIPTIGHMLREQGYYTGHHSTVSGTTTPPRSRPSTGWSTRRRSSTGLGFWCAAW